MLVDKDTKVVVEELLHCHLGIFGREFRFCVVCRHHQPASDALQDLGFTTIFLRVLLYHFLDVLRGI